MTLCTATWDPFDPTTQLGTKNLLGFAAYNSVPTSASATLSIDDATIIENAGSAILTVTVNITNPQKQELHLQFGWSTYDKTAIATSDYVKSNGAIDVNITGSESQLATITRTYPITISIVDDMVPEVSLKYPSLPESYYMNQIVDEDMQVRIGVCPSPAIKILKDTAVVSITDDDKRSNPLVAASIAGGGTGA